MMTPRSFRKGLHRRRNSVHRKHFAFEPLEHRQLLAATAFISEVHPSGSGNGTYAADWIEITNPGPAPLNITGWKMDDNSNGTPVTNQVPLRGVTSIPAGKSAVFFEGNAAGTTDAAITAAFCTAWFGSPASPAGFLIGAYGGSGVGLGATGDSVNLFDAAGNRVTGVSFGNANAAKTFDNAAGTGSSALPLPTITNLSAAGVNGAFLSANGAETGSPGRIIAGVDLSNYARVGRFDLPEPTRTAAPPNSVLAQEVSAVTYDWDTGTLFVVGDGGTSVVQVSKTGQLIDSMTLATGASPQGTEFFDTEGLTYVGGGKFVFVEERDRQVDLFTYVPGTTLNRSDVQTVDLGTFVPNIGIEGISYDPQTNGFIAVKEIDPQGIFQTGIDFAAGTATNGSPTTENSVNLFDPALAGLLDFADVFSLSNVWTLNGFADSSHLLVLSQESGKIVNIDRSGNISSSLTIVSDPGNPLTVPAQQHEGLTMDDNGFLYVVSENGGGDFDHPQLWIYAPSFAPNTAPTALALTNQVNSLAENTSTLTRLRVADIAITDDGLGTNNLTVTGPDAAFFEVDSNGLYIKAGTTLDFETKSSYSVTVVLDDPAVGTSPDATADYSLSLTDVINEDPGRPSLFISEVAPFGSGSPVGADWFEVTNNGNSAVNLTGWKMDDGSALFSQAVPLSGITSINPGESVIFIETDDLAAKFGAFLNTWFGGNAPSDLRIGSYAGTGVSLSTGGDGVNLFDSAGALIAGVSFGQSPSNPLATFNNAAGLNNAEISELSKVAVNGAFRAANDPAEIGSPGTVGRLFISEVAPWASGNSPIQADWFEVTNSTAHDIDISGWKMDDSSGSFAASAPLNGITTIAAGESVIFIEADDPAAKIPLFLSTWFGSVSLAHLQIGTYTGGSLSLSTGGDGVNLYNKLGVLQAGITFRESPAGPIFSTFDNSAALNNTTVSTLSAAGARGAFAAADDANEIGSPGTINNSPPSAANDNAQTLEDSSSVTFNVLTDDTDADGDPRTIVSNTAPAHGALVDNGNGQFTYTPAPNFNGTDTFSYTITDGKGRTATASVSIVVDPLNDPPTADAKAVATNEDTSLAITLSGSDLETPAAGLIFTITQPPAHGTLSGTGANLTYTPNPNYNGPDGFQYTVTDAGDGSSAALTSTPATVSINVTAVNDVPVVSVPGAQLTVEDIAVAVTGISVADLDATEGTGIVKVTLSATLGKLTVNTAAAGGLAAAQISGNGTGVVVLQGALAMVNATLAAGVKFQGNLNVNGIATLSVTTNDLGNTGLGGPKTDTKTVAIQVLSPTQQIARLRSMVEALFVSRPGNGPVIAVLTKVFRALVLSELDVAQAAIDKNKPALAYATVALFELQLKVLTPAQSSALISAADLLLQSLKIGGGF